MEQRHYRFKEAANQALMMRSSRDFSAVDAYQLFIHQLFGRVECRTAGTVSGRGGAAAAPAGPPPRFGEAGTGASQSRSLVTIHRNCYSVHSRLIGEMIEARIYSETVEIWYADRKAEELPRLRGRSKHRIDYRQIIDWLVRKPGAFENYRYRSDLFPTSWFRLAYDALREE